MRTGIAFTTTILLLNGACPAGSGDTDGPDLTDGGTTDGTTDSTTMGATGTSPTDPGGSGTIDPPTTSAGPTATSVGPGTTSDEAQLTVEVLGDGVVHVDPPGQTCDQPVCQYNFLPTAVTLTAAPAAGAKFVEWSGDCLGGEPVTDITVTTTATCTATFEPLPDGVLPALIDASRQVVRVPADDAPASDSESLLKIVGPAVITGVTWTILAADDGSEIATSSDLEYLFTCPPGRRAYDVRATVSDGQVQSTLFERRLLTCVLPRSDAGRTVHAVDIGAASYFQNGEIDGVKVAPGDLVRISGDAAGNFAFFNFQGTAEQPIHVINDGPVSNTDASWLLHLINCQHLIIDGLGDDSLEHGITLANSGDGGQAVFVRNYTQGSSVNTGSTGIEIYGVEIAEGPDSGFRIWNGGTDEYDAGNWAFADLRLHHNYVHDVATEGFYVGYFTDNVDLQPPSYPIVDAKVYRNRVADSGWDGMQFGSCAGGLEVHDNLVTGSALAGEQNQRSSLQWNPGNTGAVYKNRFIGGLGVDLQVGCGGGDTLMYSNVFVHSEGGFYLHAGESDGPRYWLFANSVGAPNTAGLRVNMLSAPGNCAAGTPVSELHYASNLLLGGVADAWEFAAGTADTVTWTVEPNLVWTGDPGELCLDDQLAPTCSDSGALAGTGATLADMGLTPADLPGGHFVDIHGRVLAGPANFGAHQAPIP